MSAAGKVNAANLTNGTTILVEPGMTEGRLVPARLKTGALAATVLGVKAAVVGRRTGRAVQVALADGSEAVLMVASVQTFWMAPAAPAAPAVAPATTPTTDVPAADETDVSDTTTEEPTMTATTAQPTMTITATYFDGDTALPNEALVSVTVATEAQAHEVVAGFPVTANLRVREVEGGGYAVERLMLLARYTEDGTPVPVPRSILHLPRIVRHARQLGMTVKVKTAGRRTSYTSLAKLDEALAPLAALVPGWAAATRVTLAG
jgi:hypothetical protein